MEIALVAGLAFLGYEISKNNKQTRPQLRTDKQTPSHPFKNDPLSSNNPANMNFNQYQPYIKDKHTPLNVNASIETRALEKFTGRDDVAFQHRREQACLFKPEENRQNIFGNQVLPNDIQNRYTSSLMMNNVAPIEQQQVGPGLNVGSDVTAKGGFHQYFRILPNNVGGYKKNTFGGRVISGKGMTENRTMESTQEVRKPQTFYKQSQHPTMEGKYMTDAPASQALVTPNCTNRGNFHDHIGIASGDPALQSRINGTRVGNVPLNSLPVGGASMENSATGGYAVSRYLVHETDRENCGVITNANDQNSGNYVKGNQIARMTEREGTSKGYSGGAGFFNSSQSNYTTAYNADQYHKREDIQISHTPNPGNMNLREDANKIVGSMKIRDDYKSNRLNIATVPNSMQAQGKPGRIENAPKVTECNPRQDFGLVGKVLETNPYTVK